MSTDIRISARESGLISSGWGNTWLSNCDKAPGFPSSVKEIPASSRGATGTSAFLSRRSRTIDPHLDLRQENGALLDRWWETQHSSRVRTCISGNFWSFVKHVEDPFKLQGKRGLSLETLQHKRVYSSMQVGITSFAWSCGGTRRVPLELPVDLRGCSCFLREVRSPLALQRPP